MSKATFFRQSGWMMIATVASGVMMWAVHFLSKRIEPEEYGALVAVLAATIVIPGVPLQMVVAQQSARALATGRQRELVGMVRMLGLATFLLWLVAVAAVLLFQGKIVDRWQLPGPGVLYAGLVVALGCLWGPIANGLLQGEQNFLWLGWAAILNGVGRISVATTLVFLVSATAAGILWGAVAGSVVAIGLGLWFSRPLWTGPSAPFDWPPLLKQVLPLALGFAAYQFLFSADTMFVKSFFSKDQTAYYGAAGTLSRALIWLVGPLTAVMFPKIVHSAARAEKSDVLGLTLLATAVLAGGSALGLSILSPWVVPIVYPSSYVAEAVRLIPWYAGAMVPLALANVLVNNLLAQGRFRIVPWLLVLAGGYALTLSQLHPSPIAVLQILAGFCVVLFLICAAFTWGGKLRGNRAKA